LLLGRVHIQLRVIEVDVREEGSKKGLCLVHAGFEGFYILRGRVAAAVGRLIVRTLYREMSDTRGRFKEEYGAP
jgi:predicted aspartyl protease